MAKFKVIKAAIDIIPQTARANKGEKYVRLTAVNCDDFFADPRDFLFFNKRIVDAFLALATEEDKKNATNDSMIISAELTAEMGTLFGHYETVKYDKPFIMHYMNDLTDGAGNAHKKGEIIMNGLTGKPRLYNSIEVFCRDALDSTTGKYAPARNNDANTLATQRFNAQCEFVEDATIAKENEGVGENAANNVDPTKPAEQNHSGRF